MYSTIRYIIPKNWFDGINEYSNGGIANYINFNNSQFISEENNTLKKDINIKNIILVVYETMDKIIKYFDVDYAIKINIYFENLIDLDEAVIYKLPAQIDEGLKIKKSFIAVQFMKYPEFCIKGLNNKDEPDGNFMGYSVGCPRYKENDGIHKRRMFFNFVATKEKATEKWNEYCEVFFD